MDNSPGLPYLPRFDWYSASVAAEPSEVLEALEGLTDGAAWEPMQRVPFGYGSGWRLVDADGQVACIWAGGRHERPHVVVTGESAPVGARVLREVWPVHSVSRADVVALDSAEPGAYDRLQAAGVAVAQRHRVKVGTAGDHLLTFDGRTCYLGSPSSAVRCRIYDKAAELRAKLKDPAKLASVPDHLARVELQVRPTTSDQKARCAAAEPVELLGSAAWSRELVRHVAGLELQPFAVGAVWREADDERARAAMVRQYGAMLERLASDLGSWECVGLQLRDDLARCRRG